MEVVIINSLSNSPQNSLPNPNRPPNSLSPSRTSIKLPNPLTPTDPDVQAFATNGRVHYETINLKDCFPQSLIPEPGQVASKIDIKEERLIDIRGTPGKTQTWTKVIPEPDRDKVSIIVNSPCHVSLKTMKRVQPQARHPTAPIWRSEAPSGQKIPKITSSSKSSSVKCSPVTPTSRGRTLPGFTRPKAFSKRPSYCPFSCRITFKAFEGRLKES